MIIVIDNQPNPKVSMCCFCFCHTVGLLSICREIWKTVTDSVCIFCIYIYIYIWNLVKFCDMKLLIFVTYSNFMPERVCSCVCVFREKRNKNERFHSIEAEATTLQCNAHTHTQASFVIFFCIFV